MTNLQIFAFEEKEEIRTLLINDEPYFVGKDVAEVLGYQNGSRDVNRHVDEEDKLTHQISASGQNRNMTIINESGLYSLILKSKLPSAKKFKRWVTSEVLPAIRKHGGYLTPEKVEEVFGNNDSKEGKFMDKLNTTIVFSAPIIIYLLSVWGSKQALIGVIVYLVWMFAGLDEAEYRAKKPTEGAD